MMKTIHIFISVDVQLAKNNIPLVIYKLQNPTKLPDYNHKLSNVHLFWLFSIIWMKA